MSNDSICDKNNKTNDPIEVLGRIFTRIDIAMIAIIIQTKYYLHKRHTMYDFHDFGLT